MLGLRAGLVVVLVLASLTLPPPGTSGGAAADGLTISPRGRCVEVSNRRYLIRVNCNASDRVELIAGDFPFGVVFGPEPDTEGPRRGGPRTPDRPPRRECHPAYTGCLPTVDDLDCPEINDRQVRVRDPENDPYGLDVSNGVGNGITCDDEG